MSRRWPWSTLGIGRTEDKGAIRKAYSARLKELDLDKQITEYADLRSARDEALWLAANAPDEDDDFGLGSLDEPADEDFDEFENAFTIGNDPQLLPPHIEVKDVSFPPGFSAPLRPILDERPEGWDELADLIFPDGEQSNEGFTLAEAATAEAALHRVIAWAEDGDISRHTSVDYSLADMLAGGWPRSAPLVERANEAFHWLGEAGGLDERHAVQFLNARVEGMRFHDAVVQDGHPLHKAWTELSQPGAVSTLGRLKVKRSEIEDLLKQIRSGFPELESLLDPERVESWETPGNDIVSYIVQRLFILFLVVQALRFCAGADDETLPSVLPDLDVEQTASQEQVDAVVAEVFGEGFTGEAMREADPIYTVLLGNQIERGAEADAVVQRVRKDMRRAIEWTARENVVELQSLYRGWLASSLEDGDGKCTTIQQGSFPARSEEIEPELKAREQALALQMLRAKDFQKLIGGIGREDEERTFTVPGPVIERAMAKSGLPEETFTKRFEDVANPGACEASIAILDVILEDPSAIEDDLLRGMW